MSFCEHGIVSTVFLFRIMENIFRQHDEKFIKFEQKKYYLNINFKDLIVYPDNNFNQFCSWNIDPGFFNNCNI